MLDKIDVQKFQTLIETNALINSSSADIDSLLVHILESATRLCGAEASGLLLVDRNTQELYFEASLGMGNNVKRHKIKIGDSIAGRVAGNNSSVIVDEASDDTKFREDISKILNFPVKSMLVVPMRLKDKCIGVIELINKRGANTFSGEDLEWLEIFADQAGIAIVNAKHIEQAHDKIKQLFHEQIKSNSLHNIVIAKNPVILEKLQIVDRVARTDASVLLLGESGVGKEIFAEQIHLKSKRGGNNFVKVNCAAIPEGLLESELFGHVKGAFTGAIANRHGRFELANGGTIFLDEIAELPLALQVKLLRAIQEKTFEKVGSDSSVTVDVRILAATNRDIEKQVENGEFRGDLYYRLNVLPLYIPPLRQRPEDIPDLASFFLKKFMKQMNVSFDGFSEEAMETMLSYSWPGNIRELENCIERACVIGKSKMIEAQDLFLKVPLYSAVSKGGNRDLKTAENSFRAHFITQILEEYNWNQTEAAKALAIQRTYLSRLIKELDIGTHKEQRK